MVSEPSLPQPDPAFRWTVEAWGPVLRCVPLEAIAQHAFTSRQPRLPIGSSGRVPDAWAIAAHAAGADANRVLRVKQVHGKNVRVVLRQHPEPQSPDNRPDGDAIVSNQSGDALSVSVADCVPILLADAASGAAAAIHAGWRGTCAGVTTAVLDILRRECAVQISNCIIAIGPSAGPEEYEVGSEVREAFLEGGHPPASVDRWFRPNGSRFMLDLWSANRDQLVSAGARPDRIFISGLSTLAHPDVFESFRAEGPRAGRMATLVIVPASLRPTS